MPARLRYSLVALIFLFLQLALLSASPPPENGQTLTINGMQMYFETYGEGEALVLLHGFTGSGRGWNRLAGEFSPPYRLIIPDLRGHGRTNNPSGEFTHRQSARDVYALLDALGIDRFRGIGTSTGGMTLLHMATQQPSRPEALILMGATHYFGEEARNIMRSRNPDEVTPARIEQLRKTHVLGDEQIMALLRQFFLFKDSYEDMNFSRPLLSTIQAKTLIVHGDRDEFFPVEIPFELYRSIPRSYLWIVPNGDHSPIDKEQEAFFLAVAREFLQGDWEKPKPQ